MDRSDHHDHALEQYLDGSLSDSARRAFEARLASDPALARELELTRRADESIRRQFQPPPAPAIPVPMPVRRTVPAPQRRLISRPMAAAAALAVAAAGIYLAINGSPLVSSDLSSPQLVYHRVVDAGFKPEWVCEGDKQIAEYTRSRFGARWKIDQAPGLELVGWKYSHDLLGPDATMLLATQDGQKIVLVADRKEHDRTLRGGDGLKVHRREIADLVLYEISPLEKPAILDHIHIRVTAPIN